MRQLSPEEEELLRKRQELATIRAELAERELELADLQRELAGFQGRYMRLVGVLYAELDEWRARIAELRSELDGSERNREEAARAREEARKSHEAAHGEASKISDFQPSPDLKALFKRIAKQIHPDFAKDPEDERRRTRAMAQANEAYRRGDTEALQRILDEFAGISEEVPGEGTGAALVRIIRQIAHARKRIAEIERELAELRNSELALLKQDVEIARQQNRDLLAELAQKVQQQIARAKHEHETLASRVAERNRAKTRTEAARG